MARILAVVPLYPPHSLVGAWITTHEHLRHLANRGHSVQVVAYLWPRDPFDHEGIPVHGRDAEPDADVVIAHLGDDGKGKAHADRLGAPLAYMAHGHIQDPAKLNEAQAVVFNSDSLRGDHSGVVAHPPLNPEDYRTIPGDRVTLVNLSPEKGGDLFWMLAQSMPSTRFLGVRGGYGRQLLRQAPNAERIRTTPNMRDDVYARTRILLMPSERESWGRVALEAACSGIPTIAHPTPGLIESLGTAGVFVDRADLTGWRREIERLQDPDEWTVASARAFERAGQFDPAASLRTVAETVEALIGVAA